MYADLTSKDVRLGLEIPPPPKWWGKVIKKARRRHNNNNQRYSSAAGRAAERGSSAVRPVLLPVRAAEAVPESTPATCRTRPEDAVRAEIARPERLERPARMRNRACAGGAFTQQSLSRRVLIKPFAVSCPIRGGLWTLEPALEAKGPQTRLMR
jgi:hypothetical protein